VVRGANHNDEAHHGGPRTRIANGRNSVVDTSGHGQRGKMTAAPRC
jgi:hypothetical protein